MSKRYGARPLFSGLSLVLNEGDHVGLVGPNGSGKSTLLGILAGTIEPDAGSRSLRKGLRVGYVPQESVFPADLPAEEVLVAALAGMPLEDYEKASRAVQVLGRLGFDDPRQRAGSLSGGWRKRLAIARELVQEPEVLLLDEPTNHLDLEGIVDLETLLEEEPQAFVVVSHDRYFLENVAQRMIELDGVYPSGLLEVDGPYSALLEKRDEVRRNQAEYQESLANRARRELEWLRRGPKARRTKAKSRVVEAHRLLGELDELKSRSVEASVGIDFSASGRKTKRLLAARGLAKSFGARTLFAGVDLLLRPGTRLGLLGPNGSGKSTLISVLAGVIEPDAGEIERAPQLQTVVFEQGRESLDPAASLRRALAPEGDTVVFEGRALHVASWARRFLFRSEQLEVPVSQLSGGEQARVAIARLMLRPADLLILDEPTDDLDIATLEVLEESLLELPGALVLVTHDRYLLDRVCTSILALDGQGGVATFADTAQWQEHRAASATLERTPAKASPPRVAPSAKTKKLSWAEQKEWERIEEDVLAAEQRLSLAQGALEDPAVATDAAALAERLGAVEAARAEVDRLYARWAELEEKRG
ncbi:MAG TPA: ABC-F family ATP-binding cassette domain-containing protein [Thermoanaerobaculia bacterium]|nr:ABC-F family ATP-binding cassette domain-containing protein [Thermoanaerobaculia bacterium]